MPCRASKCRAKLKPGCVACDCDNQCCYMSGCCTRMEVTLCRQGTVAWDLEPGHDIFRAALPPQDLTLSDVISVEWQPSGQLSCAGLTALRLHECYGNEYNSAAEVKDYRFYSEDLPATRLTAGEYLRNLRDLSLVDFRFAEIPRIIAAATALRLLTCTNKAPQFRSFVEPQRLFSAHQAAEVLARLPQLRELRLSERDWEPGEWSTLSAVLPGVSIIAQTNARSW